MVTSVTESEADAAIGWLRLQGVDNIAEAFRRNAAQVPRLLRNFGILKQ